MMKKCIAILLALIIAASVLPTAFAGKATVDAPKKSIRIGSKVVAHIESDLGYIKQLLMEYLDDAMSAFKAPGYYYSGIWNEAQTLYKNESKRILAQTEISALVEESFFGYAVNDTTAQVVEQLQGLSALNKTCVRSASDLTALKTKLKQNVAADIKQSFIRSEFNDFYWDKIVGYKDEMLAELAAADTFGKYILAENAWEDFFEWEPIDEEYADVYEYYDADVLSNDEMQAFAELLEAYIYTVLYDYKNMGFNIERVAVYDALETFEKECSKALYGEKLVKLAEAALDEIARAIGVSASFERERVTGSVRKKAFKRLDTLFLTYSQQNYSEENWYDIEDLYIDAMDYISECTYKDQIADRFFQELKKEMDAVKTLAQELKAYKASCIEELREYLGDPMYNQSKVKPLVTNGTKAINAAKDEGAVEAIYDKYMTALEKTVYTFKITVTKTGKGAVSKTKTVTYGSNYTVKIVPNAGYKIKSIAVDGKKVKLVNAYTFKNIKKSHTIKVTFGK